MCSADKSILDLIDICFLVWHRFHQFRHQFRISECALWHIVSSCEWDYQRMISCKQDLDRKSISDVIDLYLPVCSVIDSIKSDTNSEYPNVHCGILAPVNGIIKMINNNS